MMRVLPSLALLLAFTSAESAENTIVLHNGKLPVKVPAEWAIIAHQPGGNRTLVAFQTFDNPAEEGTEFSTNLVITTYNLGDAETALSFVRGLQEKQENEAESEFGDWAIRSWSGGEGGATYQIRDARCNHPELPIGIHVRVAWPQLEGNPKEYDARMRTVLEKLLGSIVRRKPETRGEGDKEAERKAPIGGEIDPSRATRASPD